jgi:hypothetical protein
VRRCLEEFSHCLDFLGRGGEDDAYARRLFVEFDKDNSGSIDEDEFGMIMLNEFCRSDSARGMLVQAETNAPWVIPSTGYLCIEIDYQCEEGERYHDRYTSICPY